MTDAVTSDLFRAKRGVAVLATCIVQTMNETDPTFTDRFLRRVERAYYEIREGRMGWEGDTLQELELLKWMRVLLTDFNRIDGQGRPFLAD
jgi:hypothetical protein